MPPKDDGSFEQARALLSQAFLIDPATITADSRLKEDLGLDSLDAVEIADKIEPTIGRRLEQEELLTLRTVGDVATLLSPERKSERS